jgi:hypothetical protein
VRVSGGVGSGVDGTAGELHIVVHDDHDVLVGPKPPVGRVSRPALVLGK